MKLHLFLSGLIIGSMALTTSVSHATDEKVYKWKDNRGIVHYSSKVPNDVQYEEVKRGLKKKVFNDNQNQSRKEFLEKMNKEREAKAQKEQLAEQKEQMTAYCNSLRARLATVQSGQLIKVKGKLMSGDERDQEISSLNAKISEDCSS